MSYQLTFEAKPNYVHLRVTGEVSPEAVQGYMQEGIEKCVQLGFANVLIEESLTGPTLDIETLHRVISEMANRARSVLDLIAYVNLAPGHDPELMRFAENVAVNRAVRVRVFRNVAEAEKWISFHGQSKPPSTDPT